MEIRKVVAFIRNSALEQVEKRLKTLGIEGISVFQVKGYGEYANFSRKTGWSPVPRSRFSQNNLR